MGKELPIWFFGIVEYWSMAILMIHGWFVYLKQGATCTIYVDKQIYLYIVHFTLPMYTCMQLDTYKMFKGGKDIDLTQILVKTIICHIQ